MEQADIERVRRVLRQRPKPPWRVLWRGRPHQSQARDPSSCAMQGLPYLLVRVDGYRDRLSALIQLANGNLLQES
jgi:hypothetical protein